MAKDKKTKKEKVRYVDDGRTVADMSNVPGTRMNRGRSIGTAKDKWDTYWGAVKRMIVPMLIVMGAICVIYMLIWFIFFLMY